jgi:hypothetical protein
LLRTQDQTQSKYQLTFTIFGDGTSASIAAITLPYSASFAQLGLLFHDDTSLIHPIRKAVNDNQLTFEGASL